MNKNVIIVFSGALAVALVVALLVQVSLGGKKQEAVKEAKVEILVAEKRSCHWPAVKGWRYALAGMAAGQCFSGRCCTSKKYRTCQGS